jgi:hypothetical protein
MRRHGRQQFERCVSIDIPVRLYFPDGKIVAGTAFNLSRVGVLVRTRGGCQQRGLVELRMLVDGPQGAHIVRLSASIVHGGRRVVGLMLRELDDLSGAAVDRLLSHGMASSPINDPSMSNIRVGRFSDRGSSNRSVGPR